MHKRWAAFAALALAVAGTVTSVPLAASADVVNNGTLFTDPGYDYGASIIQSGSVRQYWWCSPGSTPDGYSSDTIKYRTYNSSTKTYSAIQTVLAPSPSVATWDRSYICDPTVVRGQFTDPSSGSHYSYAMYYTATDRGPGSTYSGTSLDGTNNRIGLAYSNDGVSWVRYSQNPVIYPQNFPTDTYGVGQAASYNQNGASALKVFVHDESPSAGPNDFERDTTNATSFGTPTQISGAGTNADGSSSRGYNADFAYDQQTKNWYAIWPLAARPSGGDRETYHAVLAKMSAATFPTGTWQRLTDVDTNSTGNYLVNNPALVRDGYGNGNVDPTYPSVEVVYGGGDNDPSSWDLNSYTWSPPSGNRPLNRYGNSSTSTHLVTTGYVPSGYTLEQTLGYLSEAPAAQTVPLYGCRTGGDYFVSKDYGCEGQTPLGNNGYIWTSAPSGVASVQIYRCYTGRDHFVSTSSTCEGQHVDLSLGWVKTSA